MEQEYAKLDTHYLPQRIGYVHPERSQSLVHSDSSAMEVFTDFKSKPAATCHANKNSKQALDLMQKWSVKTLMVIDDHDRIMGIVHIRDLSGLKLGQAASHQGCKPEEVLIKSVMTSCGNIPYIYFKDLSNARVGHIIRILHEDNLSHLLVVENIENHDMQQQQVVRGIFTIGRINRLTGQSVQGDLSSHSIAEFNKKGL